MGQLDVACIQLGMTLRNRRESVPVSRSLGGRTNLRYWLVSDLTAEAEAVMPARP